MITAKETPVTVAQARQREFRNALVANVRKADINNQLKNMTDDDILDSTVAFTTIWGASADNMKQIVSIWDGACGDDAQWANIVKAFNNEGKTSIDYADYVTKQVSDNQTGDKAQGKTYADTAKTKLEASQKFNGTLFVDQNLEWAMEVTAYDALRAKDFDPMNVWIVKTDINKIEDNSLAATVTAKFTLVGRGNSEYSAITDDVTFILLKDSRNIND